MVDTFCFLTVAAFGCILWLFSACRVWIETAFYGHPKQLDPHRVTGEGLSFSSACRRACRRALCACRWTRFFVSRSYACRTWFTPPFSFSWAAMAFFIASSALCQASKSALVCSGSGLRAAYCFSISGVWLVVSSICRRNRNSAFTASIRSQSFWYLGFIIFPVWPPCALLGSFARSPHSPCRLQPRLLPFRLCICPAASCAGCSAGL